MDYSAVVMILFFLAPAITAGMALAYESFWKRIAGFSAIAAVLLELASDQRMKMLELPHSSFIRDMHLNALLLIGSTVTLSLFIFLMERTLNLRPRWNKANFTGWVMLLLFLTSALPAALGRLFLPDFMMAAVALLFGPPLALLVCYEMVPAADFSEID